MKSLERVWKRVKDHYHRKRKPVIRISRQNPWGGEKLVRVPVPNTIKKIVSLLILSTIALSACAGKPASLPQTGEELSVSTADASIQVVDAALTRLSQSLGVKVEQIQVLSSERVEWPDTCLGLPGQNESCGQVVTPGFRIVLSANGQQYEFHTNESGTQVRQK